MCGDEVVQVIRRIVREAGLSDQMPHRTPTRIWNAMLHDKKVSAGQVIGVWPTRIGEVRMAPLDKQVFDRWHAKSRATSRKEPPSS
jgi:3-dehydroquinate synthase